MKRSYQEIYREFKQLQKEKDPPLREREILLTAFRALKRALTVLWGFLEPITWIKVEVRNNSKILRNT